MSSYEHLFISISIFIFHSLFLSLSLLIGHFISSFLPTSEIFYSIDVGFVLYSLFLIVLISVLLSFGSVSSGISMIVLCRISWASRFVFDRFVILLNGNLVCYFICFFRLALRWRRPALRPLHLPGVLCKCWPWRSR